MDFSKIKAWKAKFQEYYGSRIVAELEYAIEVSEGCEGRFDAAIEEAVQTLDARIATDGGVGRAACEAAEACLRAVGEAAKSITVLCVAHAHIDMNWMWGYDETVAVTLSTFRTMLDLMKEYPDFRFSQSQAAVYRMVERYDPAMLAEIRDRVQEGRWEVSASTWVENDKNMPSGEDQLRQYLVAKRYLAQLLAIDESSLDLDFEPDTFGHSVNLPEILAECGIRYYYHCRGNEAPALVRWQAPSGRSVLVFREPTSYNWQIGPHDFRNIPSFARRYGLQKCLRVYGTGDHGGGASRRDIERLTDMATWPVMPTIRFGTYREFFAAAERARPELRSGENNYVFPGCYTSQTRIKAANRRGERALLETEKLCAFTQALGLTKYPAETLSEQWKSHLFDHFHDILPGSNTLESKEYTMGKAQELYAACGVEKTRALAALGRAIDTSAYLDGDNQNALTNTGGGGYQAGDFVFSANTGVGKTRLFLVYHPSNTAGARVVRLTLWDYEENLEDLRVTDGEGVEVEFEVVDQAPMEYWQHFYRRVDVKVDLPANGYNILVCRCDANRKPPLVYSPVYERRFRPERFVLENSFVRAEFHADHASLTRLTDKRTGRVYGDGKTPLANFQFVLEDAYKGMTAWTTGRHMKTTPILENISIYQRECKWSGLDQKLVFEADFATASHLRVEIHLDACSAALRYCVVCDWREFGTFLKTTPQLSFVTRVPEESEFWYDVPCGLLRREPADEDQVANTFVCARHEGAGLVMTSDSKHGFRCYDGKVLVNLIRSSTETDPFPENYRHRFEVDLLPTQAAEGALIDEVRALHERPSTITLKPGAGSLPAKASWFRLVGDCVLSGVKEAEEGDGIVFRFYNPSGRPAEALLTFAADIDSAVRVNGMEREEAPLQWRQKTCRLQLEPFRVGGLKVRF